MSCQGTLVRKDFQLGKISSEVFACPAAGRLFRDCAAGSIAEFLHFRFPKQQSRWATPADRVTSPSSPLVSRFKAQISELETGRSRAEKGLAEFQGKYETLRQEAGNVVKLQQERDQLALANQQLTTELTTLRSERDAGTGMIQWFLAGGGVQLWGWLIGRLPGKKSKRSGW